MKPSIKFRTATLPLLIAFALPCVVSFALSANGQAPPGTLWYNGDFTGDDTDSQFNQIGSGCGGPLSQIYDDFTVPSPFGWNVTEVSPITSKITADLMLFELAVQFGRSGRACPLVIPVC